MKIICTYNHGQIRKYRSENHNEKSMLNWLVGGNQFAISLFTDLIRLRPAHIVATPDSIKYMPKMYRADYTCLSLMYDINI